VAAAVCIILFAQGSTRASAASMFRVYVSSQDLAHFGSYGSKDGSNGQDDTFKHGTSQFHLSNSSDLRHFNA
jgi:hypothetical protein